MTAQVNLLPGQVAESNAATRQRLLAVLLVVVVLAALGGLTFWQRLTLQDAEDELADAQSELAAATAEVNELALHRDLQARQELANELIIFALADQVSLAGILQDIAMVMPDGSDVGSLAINFADSGDSRLVGMLTASGESVDAVAPGIERLVLQFERAAGFRDVFVTTTSTDEDGITSYTLELGVGPEHRTERYADGLPEVSR